MKVKRSKITTLSFHATQVLQKKRDLAHELFGGICYICEKPYGGGFAFHHKEYDETRKTHGDFKNTYLYNEYVMPEVIEFPGRFRLYCKVCHGRIDQPRLGYLGHMKKDKLIRLFIGAYETIPKKRGRKGDSVPESGVKCLENKTPDPMLLRELNNLKSFLTTCTE